MKIQSYDYAAVGARVKAARKAKNYTQEYISEKIDMDCQNISNIERGVCGLSVSSLMDLCKVLEVSADYLLFGKTQGGSPFDEIYDKMDEKQKKFIKDFILLYVKTIK